MTSYSAGVWNCKCACVHVACVHVHWYSPPSGPVRMYFVSYVGVWCDRTSKAFAATVGTFLNAFSKRMSKIENASGGGTARSGVGAKSVPPVALREQKAAALSQPRGATRCRRLQRKSTAMRKAAHTVRGCELGRCHSWCSFVASTHLYVSVIALGRSRGGVAEGGDGTGAGAAAGSGDGTAAGTCQCTVTVSTVMEPSEIGAMTDVCCVC